MYLNEFTNVSTIPPMIGCYLLSQLLPHSQKTDRPMEKALDLPVGNFFGERRAETFER